MTDTTTTEAPFADATLVEPAAEAPVKKPRAKAKPKLTKAQQKKLDLANALPIPQPPAGQKRLTIPELRDAIAKAEADGFNKEDILLRLSVRDEAMLKRSPTVELHEISFSPAGMRFLGVKVVTMPSAVSWLDTKPEPVAAAAAE